MNRPIEFRAWDKNARIMHSVGVLYFDQIGELNRVSHCGSILGSNIQSFELMQYTGLKDKNGKKIFEGDIVIGSKDDFMSNVIGVVKYSGLAFVFEGRTKETQYALCGGKGDNYWRYTVTTSSLSNLNEIEVIGNIYENSELLKDTNE